MSMPNIDASNDVNAKIWYYAKADGSKYGPYTDSEIVKLISNGILSENDLIWMVDLEQWMTVGNSIYSFYLPKHPQE